MYHFKEKGIIMKELTQAEYETLREQGEKLIGRVYPHAKPREIIYYQIAEDQKDFSCTEVLDTLLLTHREIVPGRYDVFRHWADPEVKSINYTLS
mgnify:FL=1